ncbi:MAG: phospholipase D-like domain-containing protein [Candidatus Hydrogenedentota bacterium]
MAKKSKKKAKHRPLRKLVLVLLFLLIAAGGYTARHFYQGDTWPQLRQQAMHTRNTLQAGYERIAAFAQTSVQEADGLLEAATIGPPPDHGQIRVFFGPTTAPNPRGIDDHLAALIGRAEDHAYAAFYDLGLDIVADALIERHEAGITVAVVSDSHYEDREAMAAVREAGIPVVFDKRSAYMHNKFVVVDGRYVWTGSMNVTPNGAYRNNNNALLIASPKLATNYTHEFREMFEDRAFGARSPENTTYPTLTLGDVSIECYFAPEDDVEEEVVAEVRTADATIDFMAFSYTSEPIAEAMAKRIVAGVSVRGLFEKRNAGSQYSRDDFLEDAGATVYMDTNPYSMHHKVIIVDGETVVTGSYNFSKSANTRNDENLLIIHDPAIAKEYTVEFEGLL